ncbi:MAG: hypothetical protein RQ847_11520 [Wenzhouxiangellaceae bacterium]|nr:hypothetical protein [Wenzhouxiangellaceae bacterium]
MFQQPLSRRERWWLLALRLVWQYRERGRAAVRLVDRLGAQAGFEPNAARWFALIQALERAGADHLYVERFDRTGVTGDERDLLAALKHCRLDDPLEAEYALGALVPPGRGGEVLVIMARIAGRPEARAITWRRREPSGAFPAHEFVH